VSYHIAIPAERSGMELDEFLCLLFPLLSKGFLRRQVREGKILVDGSPAVPSQRLRLDQVLSIDFDENAAVPEAPVPPTTRIPVLYEDESVLALDKPSGLAAEPERWMRSSASLAGAALEIALERSNVDPEDPIVPSPALGFRPRLLHRLDKDTTGVVLVAKSLEAERHFRQAFEGGEIRKSYLALVEGEYPIDDGQSETIDLPIGPDARKSGRMQVDREHGKPSRTEVSIVQRFRGYTLLCCAPLTGRTHQIRVHLSATGFPLAVDPVYGRRRSLSLSEIKRDYRKKPGHVETPLIDRLALHAHRIEFEAFSEQANGYAPGAPSKIVRVESPIPRDLARVLKQLSRVRPL
jgi:RluA family pseudouridine synthase